MDVLLNKKVFNKDVDLIKKLFEPNEIYNNGNVVSFDYKEFQIDFIYMSDDKFNTAFTYYSYNDLGNLMGRIANKLGVRYGHEGLKMLYYSEDKNKVLAEIHLSSHIPTIFKFLGFNRDRYLYGFKELEDIFNYVIDSEFFSKELFLYENLNHQNRTRNKKRKTYGQFLDYISELNIDSFDFDSIDVIDRINEFFPDVNIMMQLQLVNERERNNERVKEKFNGKIVKNLTGLEGVELGEFIKMYKDARNYRGQFDKMILELTDKQIEYDIDAFFYLYKTLKERDIL